MPQYQAALWWRLYWWFALLLSALGGVGLIAGAVAAHGAGSIAVAVIGAFWVALALFGLHTSRRLAWTVDVTASGVTLTGPLLRISISPRDVLEVREAPWDLAQRGGLELLTANHGLFRLGPARHVGGLFAAIREVNPTVGLPDADSA